MKTDGKRFGIGIKLIIGLGTLIGISVIVGALAITSLLSIQGASDELSQQFLPETTLANQVERSTLKTMVDARGYWLTGETKYYDSAMKDMADLEKALGDIQALLDKSPRLVKLRENLPKARAAKAAYDEELAKTKAATDQIGQIREKMDASAKEFSAAIDGYVVNMANSWEADIRAGARTSALQARASKSAIGNQIKALGDSVRIANFKTQALRDPSIVKAVLPNFQKISDLINQTLLVTVQQINKDQLALVQRSAAAYQDDVNSWLSSNAVLDDLAAQRLATGNELSGLAEATSVAGVTTSQSLAVSNSFVVAAASWTIIIGLLASLVLGIIVALILIRSITGPLSLVTSLSKKVTMGDFAIDREKVKSRDELGLLIESFY